jgi:hypothetical protein
MTDQQQPFIGSIVGAAIAKKAIQIAVDKAVDKFAKSPSTSLKPSDAPAMKQVVVKEAEKEIEARVEHVTNTEPAYQSRVTIGSVLAIVSAAVSILQMLTDNRINSWEDYSPHIGVVAGAAFALYGRWVAQKPLGR